MESSSNSAAAKQGCCEGSRSKLELQGKISRRSLLHIDLDDGTSVTGPEDVVLKPGAMGTIGDIIDIICTLTGKCGGGGGGGGCTTITIENPDGSTTTIKSCPKKVA